MSNLYQRPEFTSMIEKTNQQLQQSRKDLGKEDKNDKIKAVIKEK